MAEYGRRAITTLLTFASLLQLVPFGTCVPAVGSKRSPVQQTVTAADIALVIDQSNSIRDHYGEELDFAKKFVSAFPVSANETRFALVQFSFANMTHVRLPWSEGTSKEKVLAAVDSMKNDQLGAGTDFVKALTVALGEVSRPEAGDRKEAPNVIVLVTDGFLNNPWEKKQAQEAASKLRESGALLYAIQVKTDPELPVGDGPVHDLASLTGNISRVFAVENFDKLTKELLDRITHQITIEFDDCVYEYVASGPCYLSAGGQCVADGDLKIERVPSGPGGRACPTLNRTQIDCPREGGCVKGPDPIPTDPQMEVSGAVADASAGKGMPFWAIIVMAVVGGLILLMLVVGLIVSRTPRWRAIFTPSKPGKPQLPGNQDDSLSSSASSGV